MTSYLTSSSSAKDSKSSTKTPSLSTVKLPSSDHLPKSLSASNSMSSESSSNGHQQDASFPGHHPPKSVLNSVIMTDNPSPFTLFVVFATVLLFVVNVFVFFRLHKKSGDANSNTANVSTSKSSNSKKNKKKKIDNSIIMSSGNNSMIMSSGNNLMTQDTRSPGILQVKNVIITFDASSSFSRFSLKTDPFFWGNFVLLSFPAVKAEEMMLLSFFSLSLWWRENWICHRFWSCSWCCLEIPTLLLTQHLRLRVH